MRWHVSPAGSSTSERGRIDAFPIRWLLVGIVVFAIVTWLLGFLLRESLRQQAARNLDATLRANVSSVERWINTLHADATRFAADNREAIDSSLRSSARPTLEPSLDMVCRPIAWVVLNPAREVIQSDVSNLVGKRLPIANSVWDRLPERKPIVAWPFRSPGPLAGEGRLASTEPVIMSVMVPVSEGARPLGCVALLLDPHDELAEILSVTQSGTSGESIAFDRHACSSLRVEGARYRIGADDAGWTGGDERMSNDQV